MIKLEIIGNLGHDNKLFSKTCPGCGGIFEHKGTPACPRCNQPLVPITAKNGHKMMVSEGTIYPLVTESQKEREAQAIVKRKNAMPITYRFVILSFEDPGTGIISEPKIHPYLTKGRQIRIEINHNPIVSWFKANDNSIKCEIRLGLLYNEGDRIDLLGKKEAAHNQILPDEPIQPIEADTHHNAEDMTAKFTRLQAELSELITAHALSSQPTTEKADEGTTIDNAIEADCDVDPF